MEKNQHIFPTSYFTKGKKMTGQGPPTVLPVVTKYKYLWQISEGIINGSCPCYLKWIRPSYFPSNEHCERHWRFFPFITQLDVCRSAKSGIAGAYKAKYTQLECLWNVNSPPFVLNRLSLSRVDRLCFLGLEKHLGLSDSSWFGLLGCEPSVPQGVWRFLCRITRLSWSCQVLPARVNSNFVKLRIALYMIKENSRKSEKTFFCVQVSLYHDDFHWAVFSP